MNRLAFATLTLLACSTDTFVQPDSGPSDGGGGADGADVIGTPDACNVAQTCPPNQVCLSFDQTSSYAPFVDASNNGGQVDISSDKSVTCPHSLLATLPIVTASTIPTAAIATAAPVTSAATANGHVAADVFLPENVPGAAAYLSLAANADTNTAVMLVVGQTNTWALFLQASTKLTVIQPRVGAWNHITLDVTFSTSSSVGHALLTYTDANGDPKTAELTEATLPGGTNAVTSVDVGVGIQPTSVSTAPVSAYYDDIAFGAQ